MAGDGEDHRLGDDDPRQVGDYTLVRRLGEGGMGAVYLARDPDGREVAVKLLHRKLAADTDFRRRFAREVAAARRVARFCTAAVLAADVTGDIVYLVTEYVPGPTLREVVDGQGPLSGANLEAVAVSVAVALRAIHGAGVIHRDLKPGNVLMSPVGPKVIDFGIAQLAEPDAHLSSIILGTPAFMAPEQAKGELLTPASDVFSWGSLVAYAATGRPPFGEDSIPAILYRLAHDEPAISGVEPALRKLVALALNKDPASRPSAQELLDALTGQPVQPRAEQPGTVQRLPASRTGTTRRVRLLGGLAAAAVLAVTGTMLAVQVPQSGPSTSPTPSAISESTGGNSSQTTIADTADTGNPLHDTAVRLYTSPNGDAARQAEAWQRAGRSGDAALMRALAEVPLALWLERSTAAQVGRQVAAIVRAAERRNAVPILVTDRIPLRSCAEGGAADSAEYRVWIDAVAKAIGDRRAVVILEPNSLALPPRSENCPLGDADAEAARYRELNGAVERLGKLPHTSVYLDGSMDGWPTRELMAARLIRAGVSKADGFALNVYNHQPTTLLLAYGVKLSKCLHAMASNGGRGCTDLEIAAVPDAAPGLSRFVIDTARNGKGEWTPPSGRYQDPEVWCNPPGRGVGLRPTTRTPHGLADAYLWIRPPGLSSGRCPRGTGRERDPLYGVIAPHAGNWWARLALQRAKDAVPPLR
ncbi:glycoside hydrolase family 6 protein [Rhizohabitans arisaemae]|uniref:glycoside hydrolase family 6 protein n=1 Tax=Rhizohabitans arisaemae TaxID=2720610 RepID=UPI0024B179DF|nr:glycoside hydrolase family 6 protein [Rhizohabitans arisaemae]